MPSPRSWPALVAVVAVADAVVAVWRSTRHFTSARRAAKKSQTPRQGSPSLSAAPSVAAVPPSADETADEKTSTTPKMPNGADVEASSVSSTTSLSSAPVGVVTVNTTTTKKTKPKPLPAGGVRLGGLRKVDWVARGIIDTTQQTSPPEPMTWSPIPASTFRVRQRGYVATRRKAPSDEALFEVVACQAYDCASRIDDAVGRGLLARDLLRSASLREEEEEDHEDDPDVPAVIVTNAQLPARTGPFRASADADGAGHSIVSVLRMTRRTRRELKILREESEELPRDRANALRLLQRFCRVAPDEPRDAGAERGRFKVIAQIRNVDDAPIPAFAKSYNGKPALINKTGFVTRGTFVLGGGGDDTHTTVGARDDNHGVPYLEIDINVHGFGYLARAGFLSLYHSFKHYVVSAGFTIEGRDDDELPELILAAFDLNYLS